MTRIELTLNIDEDERTALEKLSKVEGRSIGQLINEAVKTYLRRQGQDEHRVEANLEGLREYRMRDPDFQHAIDAFVDAEAGFEDPVEGEPINGEFIDGQFKPAGPTQSRIRKLLGV